MCTFCLILICLIHLAYAIFPQAMLMRQQERLEGRVQNIDEQLNKLESDKTLMKVKYNMCFTDTHRLRSEHDHHWSGSFSTSRLCWIICLLFWNDSTVFFHSREIKAKYICSYDWLLNWGGKYLTNDLPTLVLSNNCPHSMKWKKSTLNKHVNSLVYIEASFPFILFYCLFWCMLPLKLNIVSWQNMQSNSWVLFGLFVCSCSNFCIHLHRMQCLN